MRKLIFVLLILFIPTISAAANLTLQWDYPDDDIAMVSGFRIYARSADDEYDMSVPLAEIEKDCCAQRDGAYECEIALSIAKERRLFVATAYSDDGETGPSNEVEYIPIASEPLNLRIKITAEMSGVLNFE